MAHIIQNSTLRFISDYLDIICSLINKYQCPAVKDIDNSREVAMKMREMLTTENRLQARLAQHTGSTSMHWSKQDASNFPFPPLTEQNIRDLTFGNIKLITFHILSVFCTLRFLSNSDGKVLYSRAHQAVSNKRERNGIYR